MRMRECGVPPSPRTFGWLLRQLSESAGPDGADDDTIERGFAALAAMGTARHCRHVTVDLLHALLT